MEKKQRTQRVLTESVISQFKQFHGCPKCNGNLGKEDYMSFIRTFCISCGWDIYIDKKKKEY